MNKFVARMLELGAELDKAVSPIKISMVINDAEILYKNHIEQLNIPVVSNRRELLIDFCSKVEEKAMEYKHLVPSEEFIDKYLKGN